MMKKYFLATALCFSVVLAFGQKKEVTKALNIARSENPDINAGRSAISGALTNPETKDDAKTWYTAGLIEYKQYESEYNKPLQNKQPDMKVLYGALLQSFQYYLKTAELDQLPDEKGKVKPRYLRDIKTVMLDKRIDLINGGGLFFEAKDYKKAYDSWNTYITIAGLPFLQKDLEKLPVDTNLVRIRYYTTLAATQLNDPQIAIAALTAAKDIKQEELGETGKVSDIYQLLAQQYDNLKDTVNLIKVYEEGTERFPSISYFSQNLIAMYIYAEKLDEALEKLNKSTAADPSNSYMWTLKGSILDKMQREDEALEAFTKAMEADANNADAVGNVGRILYNKAVILNDKVSAIEDNKEYMAKKNNEVLPAFKKALPYLEKAHQMKPESKDWMIALRGTYYNLNMADQLKAIEDKIGKD